MIIFNTIEEFEAAVVKAIAARVAIGVTVSKVCDDQQTKVRVTLFDKLSGNDIDTSSSSI